MYIEPDELNEGWRDILTALDNDLAELAKAGKLRNFEIQQIKEKYGELRLYASYDVDDDVDIERIINNYAYISGHTCTGCGKFPVPMTDIGGWYLPMCPECYAALQLRRGTPHINYEDAAFKEEYNPYTYSTARWYRDSAGVLQEEHETHDVTPLADKINQIKKEREANG